MKSRIISAAIVLFWAIMMITLVRDRLFHRPQASPDSEYAASEVSAEWKNQEEWMRIFYKGLPIGAMVVSIVKNDDEQNYFLSSRLMMEFKLLAFKKSVMMAIGAEMDSAFILQRFAAKIRGEGKMWDIAGLYHEGRLLYKITSGEGATAGELEMKRPPSLLEAARSNLGRNLKLKAGKVYRIPVYDPIWGGGGGEAVVKIARREKILLGDETVNAWRVETTLNYFTTISWLDGEGNTLMRQLMPDLVMRRAGREEILALNQEFAEPASRPAFSIRDIMEKTPQGAPAAALPTILPNLLQGEK